MNSFPDDIEYLFVSYGGVGTSFMLRFFFNYKKTNDPYDRDSLKHLAKPPDDLPSGVKVIYIYGDPKLAVISLFRRNFQETHSHKLLNGLGKKQSPIAKELTIEEYAAKRVDLFNFREHFFNWYRADLQNPVLFLRYETLFNHLDFLFEFMDMPNFAQDYFPQKKKRESVDLVLSEEIHQNLDKIYSPFADELNKLKPLVSCQV
ncbi:MAG: sulfotransferase domain-containing protein [Balneolaceae bacterium]|nr:sulfotransferase domain-containing protein [Balneolaceae bacterium]